MNGRPTADRMGSTRASFSRNDGVGRIAGFLTAVSVLALAGFDDSFGQGPDLTPESPGLIDVASAAGLLPFAISDNDQVFLYSFTRGGTFRDSIVVQSGASFRIDLTPLPPSPCVSLMAAMPWNLGDGAILTVRVEDDAGTRQSVELTLDPAHVREHRAWTPVQVPIPTDRARAIAFEVDAGVRGDRIGDWMGLAPGEDPDCLFGGGSSRLSR